MQDWSRVEPAVSYLNMDRKNYILFGLAFGILLTALVLYQRSNQEKDLHTGWVTHTLEVIYRFEKLASDIKSVQIFPASVRQNYKNHLLEYDNFEAQSVPQDLDYLKSLISDNAEQVKRLDTLSGLVNQYLGKMLLSNKPDTSIASATSSGIISMLLIQSYIDKGIATENYLLLKRTACLEQSQRTINILRVVLLVVGLSIIIIISVSNFYQIKRSNALESFLTSVLNTSQTGIIACEAIRDNLGITDFKIIFSNNALQKQLELKDGEVMKDTLLTIAPSSVERGTFARYVQAVETGKADEFETSFQKHDVLRWYQVNLSKLNDGVIASYSEITELKNSQQQLQGKVTELQRINSELEQYAYVASHDLQEPLRKIKTFSSLIIERFNEPSASFAKVYLNKVIVAASRMSSLINDLLNFSSLSDQSQQYVPTDLDVVLGNICNDFELAMEEKKAVVTCSHLQPMEAVPLQMNQLFYNLMNNALKFTKPDVPPHISITGTLLEKQEVQKHDLNTSLDYQEIIVTDNGIGFNPEYAQKIFVIFQRLNNKESFAGTGIGLALCQKIVTNHHGVIYAESHESNGASFHIILPLQQPPASLIKIARDL